MLLLPALALEILLPLYNKYLSLNSRDGVHRFQINFDPLLDTAHHLLLWAPRSAVFILMQPDGWSIKRVIVSI